MLYACPFFSKVFPKDLYVGVCYLLYIVNICSWECLSFSEFSGDIYLLYTWFYIVGHSLSIRWCWHICMYFIWCNSCSMHLSILCCHLGYVYNALHTAYYWFNAIAWSHIGIIFGWNYRLSLLSEYLPPLTTISSVPFQPMTVSHPQNRFFSIWRCKRIGASFNTWKMILLASLWPIWFFNVSEINVWVALHSMIWRQLILNPSIGIS